MREVDFNTYKLLYETKSVSKSAIPKSVLKSDIFQNLVSAEILESLKLGRGFKIGFERKSWSQEQIPIARCCLYHSQETSF